MTCIHNLSPPSRHLEEEEEEEDEVIFVTHAIKHTEICRLLLTEPYSRSSGQPVYDIWDQVQCIIPIYTCFLVVGGNQSPT